jgi:hypothetical protein
MKKLKAEETMSGLLMLENAKHKQLPPCCKSCVHMDIHDPRKIQPKGEINFVTEYPCHRFPEIVWRSEHNMMVSCGEFKAKGVQ